MQLLTDTFYLLSNALLLPVMVLLLVSLLRVLIQCGSTLQYYLARQESFQSQTGLAQAILDDASQWPEADISNEL